MSSNECPVKGACEMTRLLAAAEDRYLMLAREARKIVDLLREVGEDTRWRDRSQTDRVYAWYEFDEVRRLLGEEIEPPSREGA